MTLKTWKEEFYPTSDFDGMTEIQSIEHSLQKWIGLRKDNISRHAVVIDDGDVVYSEDPLQCVVIGDWSCALCMNFRYKDDNSEGCYPCPLYKSRGGVSCYKETRKETLSPWISWKRDTDPEPMIVALEKALAYQKKKENK